MPLPVENLTKESSTERIQEAISQSYEVCMQEGGRTQKECGGMIYGIARDKTGKALDYK
jgi:hypothetical protein